MLVSTPKGTGGGYGVGYDMETMLAYNPDMQKYVCLICLKIEFHRNVGEILLRNCHNGISIFSCSECIIKFSLTNNSVLLAEIQAKKICFSFDQQKCSLPLLFFKYAFSL